MALRLSTGLRNRLAGISDSISLVINGAFAAAATGWTAGAGSIAQTGTTGANSTTGFLSITNGSSTSGWVDNDAAITVNPGQLYGLSFYAKQVTVATTFSYCISDDTSNDGDVLSSVTIPITSSWVKVEHIFRVPASMTSAYIRFTNTETTTGNVVGLDEVVLYEAGSSMREIMAGGFLKLYSGSQPASADDVPGSTLLCTIYSNGTSTGLTFGEANAGVLSKTSTETWSGTAVATATAGWFRFVAQGDTAASSTTEERFDGTVATSGAQLNMTSTAITSGGVQTISTFSLTLPAS